MRRLPLLFAPCSFAACASQAAQLEALAPRSATAPSSWSISATPDALNTAQPVQPAATVLLPLPGQLKQVESGPPATSRHVDPRVRVDVANARARVEPSRSGWINAVQSYPFAEGALYQVYAAPGQVTDIALEPGERLVGPGPVAAGDTIRWIIGDTVSGTGATSRVHILLKPAQAGLQTNLVINTDRRTYHVELRATARTYMASVSWTYPADQLIAIRRTAAAADPQPATPPLKPETLSFGYRIEGDRPAWRPIRVFDDGRQVWIEFPGTIGQGEMPPVWSVDESGDLELVNFRVRGRFMVVDRLFERAELRLGGKRQQRVRIVRQKASAA